MSGHRQAALALHGLTEADRDAILTHLPAPDQATLQGYLDELTALGFDGDDSAYGSTGAGPSGLAAAPAAAVFSVLEDEPPALVAHVLALQEWPWKSGLLALYPSARRELIRAAAATAAPAPARARFLREALETQLGQLKPAEPLRPAGALAALRRWRPWRR